MVVSLEPLTTMFKVTDVERLEISNQSPRIQPGWHITDALVDIDFHRIHDSSKQNSRTVPSELPIVALYIYGTMLGKIC